MCRQSHRVAHLLMTDEGAATAFETAEGTALSVATATRAATALTAARAAVALRRAASFVLTAAHTSSTVEHHCRPSVFVLRQWTQK